MNDIAIIGYSGVFPGVDSLDELACQLKEGNTAIQKITRKRLEDTCLPYKESYYLAGYLDNITSFDPKFFGVSQGEAEQITPHQRLLLQEAYKTFEHANYRPSDLKGSNTSVYVGDVDTNYYLMAKHPSPALIAGNMKSLNAGRIARFFDLRGGAYSIDTACSSTLTAINLASTDLSSGQSDMALVCGVNLYIFPAESDTGVSMGIESAKGKCAPFSSYADGTLSGEVAACVLLKDYEGALADGDTIHGVIKGVAVNQDGALSSSITAPSSEAQTMVIKKALKNAGMTPEDVTFIEAHGTGTKLGDPIEIEGLAQVFSGLPENEPVYLSTIKSNIGHTNSAAGIAGLIKVLLSFKTDTLFSSVHAFPLNEYIDFDEARVSVLKSSKPWGKIKRTDRKVAGISSFGLMGTNVHMLVEAPPKVKRSYTKKKRRQLFCVTAKSKTSLEAYKIKLKDFLDQPRLSLSTLAETLHTSREIYAHRQLLWASDAEELRIGLDSNQGYLEKTNGKSNVILVFDEMMNIKAKTWQKYAEFFPALTLTKQKTTFTSAQISLLIQLQTYELWRNSGMQITDMIGSGLGKLTIRVLKKEISQEEAMVMANEQAGKPPNPEVLKQKAMNLLQRYKEGVSLVNIGYQGILGEIFKNKTDGTIAEHYVFGLTESNAFEQALYTLFKLGNQIDPRILYLGNQRSTIVLPTYEFDSVRCWLRPEGDLFTDEPSPTDGLLIKGTLQDEALRDLPIVIRLQQLWEEVLKTDIDEGSDFFELGGHSLNGQQLINRINDVFGIEIEIDEIFEHGTPIDMAERLTSLGCTSVSQKTKGEVIPAIQAQDSYPVSYAQNRLWLLAKLSNNSPSLHVPSTTFLEGQLDLDILSKAFKQLLQRHESLRTIFILEGSGLRQKVLSVEKTGFVLNYESRIGDTEAESSTYLNTLQMSPFDLEKGPLIRVNVLQVEANKYLAGITLHHIICDGWSINILQKELFHIYNALSNKKPVQLPVLNIHYKDYSVWLQNKESSQEFQQARAYWLKRFAVPSPALNLKGQKARPKLKTYRGRIERFVMPDSLTKDVQNQLRKEGGTLTMLLNTAINVMLYKLSGQTDVTIGMPFAERVNQSLEHQIGLYLNMLACRTKWNGELSFKDLLAKTTTVLKEAYKHKVFPFEMLVNELDLKKDHSRFPLFDVVLSVQNFVDINVLDEINDNITAPVEVKPTQESHQNTAQFDLTYRFFEGEKTIYYEVEYNTDLFSADTIAQYHEYLMQIFDDCIKYPDRPLKEISFCSPASVQKQLELLAGSQDTVSIEGSIVKHLNQVFLQRADSTALVYEGQKYTYRELNLLSNQVANYLLEQHTVEQNDTIVVSVNMSPLLIGSLLGILKAGLIYVPVNNTIPKQRQAYIQDRVKAKVVIDNAWLEEFMAVRDEISEDQPIIETTADDAAYIIFTSGSTGKPKGVIISHRSLLALLLNCKDAHYDFSDEDVWTLYHNYSFDVSIWEIFGSLLFGGQLHLLPKEKIMDFKAYINTINSQGITILNFTPKVFAEFERFRVQHQLRCPSVRYVVFAGDTLYPNILRQWSIDHPDTKMINMYGITEITVHGSFKKLTTEDIEQNGQVSNIGSALQGVKFYLFDEHLRLLPEGDIGEIYISGNQVAKGYFEQEELTDERFINEEHYGLGRLYRSGDLARWLPDGNLEFIGRKDNQVQINGFRVELNEIKCALLEVTGVEDAHVSLVQEEGTDYLLAYYRVAKNEDEKELKKQLSLQLPHYMIPNFMVQVEVFQLNSNGKIDTAQLPTISDIKKRGSIQSQTTEDNILTEVQRIFCEVLGYEKVKEDINFFDLGGNSLQLIRLHGEIDAQWPQLLMISDLFELNTCQAIATHLKKQFKDSVETGENKEETTPNVEFLEI
ncbi:amino acid adenylation domain-containing protein [Aquimarina sp. MAR_2010_214]|uniref:non-ribosomal peptide synthetase n=1 Tax=Aquimarina sp. MAR_2010_214 TaxID=1250026 RepID=UPI000C6FD25E|nr:non-ribosomal peptide synthetase [Aquimarina sp. MAR_2010_214]PKV49528.1 amino acid adenylation domain-containing protein [Aquimarina sp. MAR_2010_214]